MTTATETPQHLANLALANETRLGHAAVRREVRAGSLSVAEAMEDPRSAGRFTVGTLVGSQHRWGPLKTTRFLNRLVIFEGRRVDALTERQKQLIKAALNHG